MELLQLVVECTMDDERERLISELGTVKYRLPMIHSYVIEIPENSLSKLRGLSGVKNVYQNTFITAQMNVARKIVKAEVAENYTLTGRGIGIAILDTGVEPVDDLVKPRNRIASFKDILSGKTEPYDPNGHGTHVSGICAGNGYSSGGKYSGIAPEAHIVSVRILDEKGKGNSAEVLAGLQWMMDNKELYNIRICNLSIGTADTGLQDPLVKAVNAAWDAGIVVTIAAGNNGPGECSVTSPGISKKVITVGASDDHKSVQIWGDNLINFSGRGPTMDCIIKPDIIAPGANIVSCLARKANIKQHANAKIISESYVGMSGTSMSTPIVTGAIALLLEKHPELHPDDVKYMIKCSCKDLKYPQNQQGWGLINIERLITGEVKYAR